MLSMTSRLPDAAAIRALAAPLIGAPFGGALLGEKLDDALAGAEGLHLVIEPPDREGGALTLIEHIAGGHGTWRVHLVCGDDGAASRTLHRALSDAWGHGGRLAVAELPVHESFQSLARVLDAAGFRDAGRIADFFADGVALSIVARDITP